MEHDRMCPLMNCMIDDGMCFDIHMVAEGCAPPRTVPVIVQENERRAEICLQCQYHRND